MDLVMHCLGSFPPDTETSTIHHFFGNGDGGNAFIFIFRVMMIQLGELDLQHVGAVDSGFQQFTVGDALKDLVLRMQLDALCFPVLIAVLFFHIATILYS